MSTNGTVKGSLSDVETLANSTLNDIRGWSQLGAKFEQVSSNGMFNIVLSQASLMDTYSSGCTDDWSCTIGNTIYINDDRWESATTAWNNAGGNLLDYRHMVINHETGHWLGHGHLTCSGTGNKAAIMQQQSIDLGGCTFNPWPLDSELWSTKL